MFHATPLSFPPLSLTTPLALVLFLAVSAHPALAGEEAHVSRHGEELEVPAFAPESAPVPADLGGITEKPQGRADIPEAGTPDEARAFFLPLPDNLRPEQRKAALAIIAEAEPRLTALHSQMSQTLVDLHNLSFAKDMPPEELGILGRKLVGTRNAILLELKTLCNRLEHETGFNPGWGSRRTCAFRHSDNCDHPRTPEKGPH